MSIDKPLVARRFNQSVTTYDQHAIVQKQMAHRILQQLEKCEHPIRRICEIGCGTGYLTNLLIQKYPEVELVAIDLAPKMIETAKSNITARNIQWVTSDAEEIQSYVSGKFDLIVSNATIQWLSNPKETLKTWGKMLHTNGWLLASTFGMDTFQELTALFQKTEEAQGLKPRQHHLTMHSAAFWRNIWEQSGLTSVDVQENRKRVPYSNCRAFLQGIKATGASYSTTPSPSLANHRLLKKVMEEYDHMYQEENHVYATYHVIHLCGQKGK